MDGQRSSNGDSSEPRYLSIGDVDQPPNQAPGQTPDYLLSVTTSKAPNMGINYVQALNIPGPQLHESPALESPVPAPQSFPLQTLPQPQPQAEAEAQAHYSSLSTPQPQPQESEYSQLADIPRKKFGGRNRLRWLAVVAVLVFLLLAAVFTFVGYTLESPATTSPSTSPADEDAGWGDWGEWGVCDATCGSGQKTRSRECQPQMQCSGSATDVTQCDTQCPTPAPAAADQPRWSSWAPWSSCSLTCGSGSQSRQRSCGSGTGKCPGDSSQDRDCPGWKCPDCSEACPGGVSWNTACTRCGCADGSMITGRVLSTQNTPQANVDISPAKAPYDVITSTDATGSFSIPSVCPGLNLIFTKQGYVDQEYASSAPEGPVLITLHKIDPLLILSQPESKSRLVGESVVLCCAAAGNPPPNYYEWFKDGELVEVDMTSEQSNLTLEELVAEDAGEYRCRANNDFSAAYSQQVLLQVKAKPDDFCPASPVSHMMKLPRGCKSPGGDDVYDVGTCPPHQCRYRVANQSLACMDDEEEEVCCGPTGYSRVDLVCEEDEDFIFVVAGCGCGKCFRESSRVKGQLQALDTSDPIPYGKVQVTGGDTVWADNRGRFLLTAPRGQRRIVVTATDFFGNFIETIKIIDVGGEVSYVVIRLLRKAPAVSLSASDGATLSMGGGEAFAGIKIPPNSVYTSDGSPYTGMVMASLNVLDPRNANDMMNVPSDLTFIDQEGQEQPLKTYGMFNLQLEDNEGNPLQAEGDIEITLDAAALGYRESEFAQTLPSIWVLDSSGSWREVAAMRQEIDLTRQKRQAEFILIGDISTPVSNVWYNIDEPLNEEICFSKVKVFETNEFINQVDNNYVYVDPFALVMVNGTYQRYSSWWYALDGYCVAHPCDVTKSEGYYGYIVVDEWNGDRAFPVDHSILNDRGITDELLRTRISYENVGNAISVDFSYLLQQTNNGPFYTGEVWWWSSGCDYATDSDNHFRFYQKSVETPCYASEDYTRMEEGNLQLDDDSNLYTWYTKNLISSDSTEAHTVVYIKVVTNSTDSILVQAASKVGMTRGTVMQGDTYGYREGCCNDTEVLCLEVKPSGYVSRQQGPGIDSDYTKLVVQLVHQEDRDNCPKFRINTDLNTYLSPPFAALDVSDYKFEMSMDVNFVTFGTYTTGVYSFTGDSTDDIEQVKEVAFDACMAGIKPTKAVPANGVITEEYHALEFLCD